MALTQIKAAAMSANSVENAHLADDAVGADELAADAVVNASVATGAAITFAKLENLDSTKILVGNGSNVATEVSMSGDATISNAGVVTIGAGAVETGMIADDAVTSAKLDTNIAVTGTVSDSKGDVRSILQNSKSASYTPSDRSDVGKHIYFFILIFYFTHQIMFLL